MGFTVRDVFARQAERLWGAVERFEARSARRLDWIAAGAVLLGLLGRFSIAWRSYLNPDEAWHSLLANASGLVALWAESARSTHPPGLIFIVHFLKRFGTSEPLLRSVSVLAGAAAAWFVYRWLSARGDRAGAVSAAVMLALSPMLMGLHAQVRGYALATALAAASLWLLETAVARDSALRLAGYALLAALAVLTEYPAAFLLPAAAFYSWVLLCEPGRGRRMKLAWFAVQFLLAALCLSLYYSHVVHAAKWRASLEYLARWLAPYLPREGEDSIVFALRGTFGQFRFLIPSIPSAAAGMALGAGVLFMWLWTFSRRSLANVFLFLLPFAAAFAAALLRLHPYGMTRQTSVLAIFTAGSVGLALQRLFRQRLLPAGLAAVLFAAPWQVAKFRDWNNVPWERNRRKDMARAVDYLRTRIPAGAAVVTDAETRLTMAAYLEPERPFPELEALPATQTIGGLTWFAARWSFAGGSDLVADIAAFRERHPDWSGPLYLADGGFVTVACTAAQGRPGLRRIREFGGALCLLEVEPAGEAPQPGSL